MCYFDTSCQWNWFYDVLQKVCMTPHQLVYVWFIFFIRIHYNSTPLLSVVKMNEVKHRVPLRFTPLLKGISGLAFCAMGYPDRSYWWCLPIATSFMVLLFQLSLSGRHNFGLNYTNIALSLFNIQGISDSFISTALPSRYHGIRNVEIYCLNKFMCAFFFKAAGGLW